ncbi:GNAT family N-acetyltransferase [soil metagenome]
MDTTGVVLRDVRDDDDLDAINAGCTVWFSGGRVRELMAVRDGTPKEMWVAELGGETAGFGQVVGAGVTDGHRGIVYVWVRPGARRRGVGTALWRAALDVATSDRVHGVMVQIDEADTTTTGIALAHGLTRRGLHLESELDLSGVEALRPLAVAPRAPGIELHALPDDGEQRWRDLAPVLHRLMADTPDNADGSEDMPYAILRTILKESWQVFGAWRDDKLVGLTTATVRDADRRRLNTILTAVDREVRGLGLATALKTSHALALHEAGWSTIVTQNMEGNDAILAINRKLGFVPTLGKRDLSLDYARRPAPGVGSPP